MIATRSQWATDTSLVFRFKESVLIMLRGRWSFDRRMKSVMPRLRPITIQCIPIEYHEAFRILISADEKALVRLPPAPDILVYGRLTAKDRDEFCESLLMIYNGIVVDRHAIGRPL